MPQNLVRMEEDTFQRLGWKEQGSLQPQLHADGSGIVPGFMRVSPCFTRLCMWNINRTTLQRMPEQSPDKTEERQSCHQQYEGTNNMHRLLKRDATLLIASKQMK